MHNVLCIYLLHKNEHQMRKFLKIYHSPLEVKGDDRTRYYLVLTEMCLLTNKVIGTYSTRLPEWVAANDDPNYEYYQLILN